MIVLKAQNDDREAFNELLEWSKDSSFIFQNLAGPTIVQIRSTFSELALPTYINLTWGRGFDPKKLTLSELRMHYNSVPAHYHTSFLKVIWENKNISKKERMKFLVDVLNKDESLLATYYAGKYFSEEASLKWNPFITKPLLDWWEKHKNKIED